MSKVREGLVKEVLRLKRRIQGANDNTLMGDLALQLVGICLKIELLEEELENEKVKE